MNVGILEDKWLSGARSVRWRDGDATRLIGALLLAVIFHLAFATTVTEFLQDEPIEPKPLPKLEEPVFAKPEPTRDDEDREEPDDADVVFWDEPPLPPAAGSGPAGEAFPTAASAPPPPAAPPVEALPDVALEPEALPEFEPIVQADPAAIAVTIVPPEARVKPKQPKKAQPMEFKVIGSAPPDMAVLAALDDRVMVGVLDSRIEGSSISSLLSSNTGSGMALGTVAGGTIGGEGGVGLVGRGTGPGLDMGRLESAYTRRIRSAVARVKSYPAEAEDDGLEGTVTLELTIDRAGTITAVEVATSSGHTVLDDAAVRSVRKLGRLPAPPAELDWQEERKVRIPVTFIYE